MTTLKSVEFLLFIQINGYFSKHHLTFCMMDPGKGKFITSLVRICCFVYSLKISLIASGLIFKSCTPSEGKKSWNQNIANKYWVFFLLRKIKILELLNKIRSVTCIRVIKILHTFGNQMYQGSKFVKTYFLTSLDLYGFIKLLQ